MHHYCVTTAPGFASSFPDRVLQALQNDIPALACHHPFLMDTLLLVSMVHMCCTDPASIDGSLVYQYRDQALRALRYAVANICQDNIDAVRAASGLLAQVSFAADRITRQAGLWVVNWMMLASGQQKFRASPWQSPGPGGRDSAIYSSSPEVVVPLVIPTDILRALARKCDDEDPAERTALETAANELGKLVAIIRLPYQESYLEKQVKAWSFDLAPPGFLRMVQQRRPKALVIVAFYLVFFKLLPNTWIYQDLARHDIDEIDKVISSEWSKHIAVPKKGMHINDSEDIAELLRNSLLGTPNEASEL